MSLGKKITTMSEKELKVFTSYFRNGKNFTGTYLDESKNGKYQELRDRVSGFLEF